MTDAPKNSLTGSFGSVLKTNDSLSSGSYEIIIWRSLYSSDEESNKEKVSKYMKALSDRGFLLTFTSGKEQSNNLKNLVSQSGLVFILEKTLLAGDNLTAMLFRKQTRVLKQENQIIIPISIDNFEWVNTLKEKMIEIKEKEEARIWLVPNRGEVYFDEKVDGTLGLTKSLRYENGGDKIRCVIDYRLNNTIDFNHPKYEHLLKQDLTFNIFEESIGKWGSYMNVETDIEEISSSEKETYQRCLLEAHEAWRPVKLGLGRISHSIPQIITNISD